MLILNRSSRFASLFEDRDKELSRIPKQKKLCRNYVKELTLNPSLGKRGTFLPPSLHKRRGKGGWVIQFFYYYTASKRKFVSKKLLSVFSIRFATRRPNRTGFRVEPNEVRFVSRKPSIGLPETIRNSSTGQKSIFSIRFFNRRPTY
jgi:hypothetical protein